MVFALLPLFCLGGIGAPALQSLLTSGVPADRQGAVEARRAQIKRGFKARHYGPEKVAKAIISAVKKNKPIRPVTPEAYLVYGVAHVAPQVMRSAARGSVL